MTDYCEHGVNLGGCGADLICTACEHGAEEFSAIASIVTETLGFMDRLILSCRMTVTDGMATYTVAEMANLFAMTPVRFRRWEARAYHALLEAGLSEAQIRTYYDGVTAPTMEKLGLVLD